jgi:hypothetical protein
MTLECLASVFRETQTPCEVIVVDNASQDGSADAIAETFPEVTLLRETRNLGFAGAHGPAVAAARAPWLLLLNPDTIVLDGALDKLLAFAHRRPEAGIWGGRTLYADGTLNPSSCWARMTVWSLACHVSGLSRVFPNSALLNPEAYGGWRRDSERAVDIVTGCLLLIRRETWERLQGFDPAFVMYGEEADLCLRARREGFRPMITPEATIVHHGGASERVREDKMVRLLKAKVELAKRHVPQAGRSFARILLLLWPLSRWLALAPAASALRRDDLSAKADTWRNIWGRREEWRDGFPAAEVESQVSDVSGSRLSR